MSAPRIVIVTGGTFGIGRAITLRLAALGHAVVAFGLEAPQMSSVAAAAIPGLTAELGERGLQADLMEADVSSPADVAAVVEATLSRHGRIDALVNNAAIGPLGTVLDTDEATFDRIMAVNLKGPYLCSRAVLPHMIRAGGGAIVNVGSGAGWGKPNMAAYSASKGGVFALGAAMAYDFLHHNIRVNTVVPGGGGIVSGMSLGRVGGDPARLGQGAPGTAAGRPATGEDIANAIAFLISPEAEAISGTVIDVGCFAHQGGPGAGKARVQNQSGSKAMSSELLSAESAQAAPAALPRTDAYYRLKADVEDFLYAEADLLDTRQYRDWLNLLAEDIVYFMPIRRNVKFGQHELRENTRQGSGISWFDEDKWTLTKRVDQILTGVHYAEEPLSRVTHMVSNVQIKRVTPSLDAPQEVEARCRFLVYQNRVEYETYTFVGKRTDLIRKTSDGWKIARREILLDQNVLQAKNLSTFF